jgi:hypothetical protein
MPTNITEVDTFTATVPVPNDSEPANSAGLLAMTQPLANRTTYLKTVAETAQQCAYYTVAGTDIAASSKYTLTEIVKNGAFALSDTDRQVAVPAAGLYMASLCVTVTADDTSNPQPLSIDIVAAETPSQILRNASMRYSTSGSGQVALACTGLLQITDVANRIYVLNSLGNNPISVVLGQLVLRRVL